jgi:hypothetical protein
MQFDATPDFDTESAYDNTTNYRYDIPAGLNGKYMTFAAAAQITANRNIRVYIRHFNSGGTLLSDAVNTSDNGIYCNTASGPMQVSTGDYVQAIIRLQNGSSTLNNTIRSFFSGFVIDP